ncbi:aldehyde dehydrogenase (NADP(+)) [Micromonospora sp. WMMD1102]|uniref:aldehyde dehydrogenase (NADP(+)) n=1 Tax=Micromonospora sp. WMMD1102 TaxID=3016105 RepID=UPI0024157DC9|nr:aldehyde dehydrogenase (NADP(+)) [Micromonospora sp. WMMD1102]MDG4786569.1 aldehyde dehydrogenase (NADP(+)) [Micromonospora sp. WMMD1102]
MDTDQPMNPYTGAPNGDAVPHTGTDGLDAVCRVVAAAVPAYAALPLTTRAELLRRIGAALEGSRDEIVALGDAETGLGTPRLHTELTRTRVQLEMFADAVAEGSFLEAVIDLPDPDALPAPRPDLRRMLVPVGPVAVYAASNFPLAFSVPGGDTASALAAGCPVVVKAHPGHPGLSDLCGALVTSALAEGGAPVGTFAVVRGMEAGRELITHPAIAAGAFTGSAAGGRALADLAAGRPDPIPFYGELGSLNPTVVTPAALAARGNAIAEAFVGSVTMGSGQFCTKPGLLFLPAGHHLDGVLGKAVGEASLGPLLNARIRDAYQEGAAALAAVPGVRTVVPPAPVEEPGFRAGAQLLAVSAGDLVRYADRLLEECFGPAALLVEYADEAELLAALAVVPGALTATVHGEEADEVAARVVELAARRAGRVIWNGWPTGVAVTWAMQHGGPWPATTGSLHTSVGVTAVRRFLRPVAYQGMPDELLPAALRASNPLGIPRRVNGELSLPS